MWSLVRVILFLVIVSLSFPSMASDTPVRIEKKPEGLRKTNPDKGNSYLTVRDRLLWRSVLKWCDECEERSQPGPDYVGEPPGLIFVYPLTDTEYIVDVYCEAHMQESEHLYYKVREHADTIESRLLHLEQFYFISDRKQPDRGTPPDVYHEFEEKGEFIRFTDPLIYGGTEVDKKKKHLIVEKRYRGSGGCGLLTIYDVSGDSPRVVEFRGKTYCSANYVPPGKWKLYPAKVRAKWRMAPNPLREDWKDKDQCR